MEVKSVPLSLCAAIALVVHLGFGAAMQIPVKRVTTHAPIKVKLRTPPPPPVQVVEALPPPPPPKPKPIPPREKAKKKEKLPPPEQRQEPVQGLSANSFATDGSGMRMAAPAGNSLEVEDTGKRLRPEDVKPAENLEENARIISETFDKPLFTDSALDAGLQGIVIVSVFVNENGLPQQAELVKRIGYGMDELIKVAILKSRYKPRKDRLGRPEAGWTEIKVDLR